MPGHGVAVQHSGVHVSWRVCARACIQVDGSVKACSIDPPSSMGGPHLPSRSTPASGCFSFWPCSWTQHYIQSATDFGADSSKHVCQHCSVPTDSGKGPTPASTSLSPQARWGGDGRNREGWEGTAAMRKGERRQMDFSSLALSSWQPTSACEPHSSPNCCTHTNKRNKVVLAMIHVGKAVLA